MKHIGMQSFKQLVMWTLSAKKDEIAELAPIVLLLWKQKDEIAEIVINESIEDLSDDCLCLIRKLRSYDSLKNSLITEPSHGTKAGKISVGLTGSLFSKDNDFAEAFKKRFHSKLLKQGTVGASVKILRNTTLGCLKMLDPLKWKNLTDFDLEILPDPKICEIRDVLRHEKEKQLAENVLPVALGLSLTEKRNEKSMNLDRMNVEDAIDLMISEEESIFNKISENKKSIEILIEEVCKAFQNGGRLFYVGAGTSGRLGNIFA